jgi:hypothetical protein
MSDAYEKIESDVLGRFELGYEFEIGYILFKCEIISATTSQPSVLRCP